MPQDSDVFYYFFQGVGWNYSMIILILKKLFKRKTVAYIAYNSAVCIQALMYYVNMLTFAITQ